jgi:hypothetical protein
MRTTGERRAGRLWWAGPTALVVLGGTTFAFVLAPEFSSQRIPDRVVVRPAASESPAPVQTGRPTNRPTHPATVPPTAQPTRTSEPPDDTVVEPTRPVVSESPDDHSGPGGGDDGEHHDRHGETDG